MSEAEARRRVDLMEVSDKSAMFAAYVGERNNRRHRPGRAFEATSYRFEFVTDYGAFRDLQRHRLLTIDWQPLTAHLGYDLPAIIEESGVADRFIASLERSRALADDLEELFPAQAPYAVALAYRIRYVMEMNAREAMHLIELRSGPQGHPSYRRVAQQMHRELMDVAGHGFVAEAMTYVDHGTSDLERLEAERRAERRREAQQSS
jgi:hypothetical protein